MTTKDLIDILDIRNKEALAYCGILKEKFDAGLLSIEDLQTMVDNLCDNMANSFIEKGQLVPIELVSKIIKDRLLQEDCANGFILDGYPRSMEQAIALDDILAAVDKDNKVQPTVFYFDVAQELLVERLVNRRSCSECGAIFNIKTMKMTDTTKCEKCGGKLIRRDDDTEEVANKRFKTYFDQTAPLIDMYEKRGWLKKLDASLDIESIYKNLLGAVK